ncbi:MAG: hypothetical protein KIPDCIKN_04367 [Haliscomenobacter sp.]|nr:hypothetical protein [Haliscomenobacter sp.]
MPAIGTKKVRDVFDNIVDYIENTVVGQSGTGSSRNIRQVRKGEVGPMDLPLPSVGVQFIEDIKVGRTSNHSIHRARIKIRVVCEPEEANEPDKSALIKMALIDDKLDAYNFNYNSGGFQNGAYGLTDPEWSISYPATRQGHGTVVLAECLRSFRVVVGKANN